MRANVHGEGRRGEEIVADYLHACGFVLLGRNVRVGPLELDIVARAGELVAIVEVRVRGAKSFEGPFASITRRKRERLIAAAEGYWRVALAKVPGITRLRIDVAAVSFAGACPTVEYIEGAIVASPAPL